MHLQIPQQRFKAGERGEDVQSIHLLKQLLNRTGCQQLITALRHQLFTLPGTTQTSHHIRVGLVDEISLWLRGADRLQ